MLKGIYFYTIRTPVERDAIVELSGHAGYSEKRSPPFPLLSPGHAHQLDGVGRLDCLLFQANLIIYFFYSKPHLLLFLFYLADL